MHNQKKIRLKLSEYRYHHDSFEGAFENNFYSATGFRDKH